MPNSHHLPVHIEMTGSGNPLPTVSDGNQNLMKSNRSDTTNVDITSDNIPLKFEIKPIFGKGLGVVATEKIPKRTTIWMEHPVCNMRFDMNQMIQERYRVENDNSVSNAMGNQMMDETGVNHVNLMLHGWIAREKQRITRAMVKDPEYYLNLHGSSESSKPCALRLKINRETGLCEPEAQNMSFTLPTYIQMYLKLICLFRHGVVDVSNSLKGDKLSCLESERKLVEEALGLNLKNSLSDLNHNVNRSESDRYICVMVTEKEAEERCIRIEGHINSNTDTKVALLTSCVFWSNAIPGPSADLTAFQDEYDSDEEEEDMVLCPVIASKFNHSCVPNCIYTWRWNVGQCGSGTTSTCNSATGSNNSKVFKSTVLESVSESEVNSSTSRANTSSSFTPIFNPYMESLDKGCVTFVTTADILPGEEICVSYMSVDLMESPAETRQDWTEKYFGFKCACDACTKGGGGV